MTAAPCRGAETPFGRPRLSLVAPASRLRRQHASRGLPGQSTPGGGHIVATYVLVPGAWLGGWAWRDVTDRLRAAGHRVYPVTLTGLGERVHLGDPAVDLDTHVADVVNLLRFEDLTDVILVGHSYAGGVIGSVADRAPERIAQVVYVDSGPLGDGVALLDTYSPQGQPAVKREVAEAGDGWQIGRASCRERV